MRTFSVPEGMPRSIFENKYSRRKSGGGFQNWGERVTEVVSGNFSLEASPESDAYALEMLQADHDRTMELALAGVMPFSGRHLQHGDMDQGSKIGELMTNCSTAMFSFVNFWLLLKGSGVGRSYDSDLCRVNWDNMPNVRLVMDGPDIQTGLGGHPDYDPWIERVQEARHKYDSESEGVRWFEVEDSAEGWVKVIEVLETAAWQEKHKNKLFIFDFSKVREKGVPIMGQQGRPASGPVPFIRALRQVCGIKGAGMKPWKQAMFIDHFLASCVAVGGVRRSARIAVKSWRDRDIIEFIDIKRGGFLHTANNSVGLDEEFWEQALTPAPSHGRRVFEAMCSAGYFDKTGEPGFLNLHRMTWNNEGVKDLRPENLLDNSIHALDLHHKTFEMMGSVLEYAKAKRYPFICNPCVTMDTWILTTEGPRQVKDLRDASFQALVNGQPHQASAFFKTGTQEVFKVKTSRGYELRLTGNHKVKVSRGPGEFEWVAVDDLLPGDDLVIGNHRSLQGWGGEGSFEEGWLVGEVVGDGGHNPDKYLTYARFWGSSQERMAKIAADYVRGLGSRVRSDFQDGSQNQGNDTMQVASASLTELCFRYLSQEGKQLLPALEMTSAAFHRGFLRGLFDADGSVQGSTQKGISVRLSQSDEGRLQVAQRMLARLGIASTVYLNRKDAGWKRLPDGRGGHKQYWVKATHELVVSRDNLDRFEQQVGFHELEKHQVLRSLLAERTKEPYRESWTSQVLSIEPDGVEDVYDCTVEEAHEFDANGLQVHNCGEIVLAVWGGYCVIGDICLANVEDLQEALDASRLMVQFLIRANTMPFLYDAEVKRTNRIGVGITGIHEFAYRHFGYTFWDLLDRERSAPFWNFLTRMRQAAEAEAIRYATYRGLSVPHTVTTIKPSGTISKVMACTEGAHLPPYVYYVRWVQYLHDDPGVEEHRRRGYPVKDVSQQYPGMVVVGFPTKMPIADLMDGDAVCAGEPSPDQHYDWLRLLEEHWLGKGNNQISYTLKYNPRKVGYEDYMRSVLVNQRTVRACAMNPQIDLTAYAYIPEEKISKEVYDAYVRTIRRFEAEAYDDVHLACEGGACPIEPDRYSGSRAEN